MPRRLRPTDTGLIWDDPRRRLRLHVQLQAQPHKWGVWRRRITHAEIRIGATPADERRPDMVPTAVFTAETAEVPTAVFTAETAEQLELIAAGLRELARSWRRQSAAAQAETEPSDAGGPGSAS